MTKRTASYLTVPETRKFGAARGGPASLARLSLALATALAVAACSPSELTDSIGTGGAGGRATATGGAGGAGPVTEAAGGAGQPSVMGATGGTTAGSAGATGAQGGAASGGESGVAGQNGSVIGTGGTAGSGQPGTGGAGSAVGGDGKAGSGPSSGGSGGTTGTGGNTPAGSTGTGGVSGTGSGGASASGSGGSVAAGSGGTGATGSGGSAATGSGGTVATGSGGSAVTGSGGAVATGSGGSAAGGAAGNTFATFTSTNTAGTALTVQVNGALSDPGLGFYQSLGSNGRTCASCHLPDQGMSVTPAGATALFNVSSGNDPLFRLIDGAVSPLADVSTVNARRTAYAMLLSKGLIRVGLPVPANADFDLVSVNDPYGYASATQLSLFRRPLPAANLRFLSSVMWDGREGSAAGINATAQLMQALMSQASDATLGHAQATTPVDSAGLAALADFELGIYSTQMAGATAGPLDAGLASGGPLPLAQQTFYAGINDPTLLGQAGLPFDSNVFSTFTVWGSLTDQGADADARRQIALGEQLFNTRAFTVTGVTGLTTAAQPSATVTCSFCHDTPGAGSSSTPRFFDLGLTSGTRITSDMPSYTLRERSTGTQVTVSDPGRALITGAFADMSTFKVPTLRGLASRAPYFHNGAAGSLTGVVGFYNARFAIGLTTDERAALAAFLSSL